LRILTHATGVGSFLLSAVITFAVIRSIELGNPELAFIVGAILGTEVAAIVHSRQAGSTNSFSIKFALGLTLGATAGVFGLVLHFVFAPFNYPEVSIPIAVIGSFVFPFVLFDTMWKALSNANGR
jgi:hypothetical protein